LICVARSVFLFVSNHSSCRCVARDCSLSLARSLSLSLCCREWARVFALGQWPACHACSAPSASLIWQVATECVRCRGRGRLGVWRSVAFIDTAPHRRRSPSLARQYCTKQRAAVSLRLMSKPYGACWLSVTYSRARRELASPSLCPSLSPRSCQTSGVARCIVTRCLCLVSQSLAVERTIALVTPYPSRQRQHISLSFSRSLVRRRSWKPLSSFSWLSWHSLPATRVRCIVAAPSPRPAFADGVVDDTRTHSLDRHLPPLRCAVRRWDHGCLQRWRERPALVQARWLPRPRRM